jgi:hypothetical protein
MSRIKQIKEGLINKLLWTSQSNIKAKLGFDGTVFETDKPLRLPDGSAATPSLSFNGSTSCGIYSTSNCVNIATAGCERVVVDGQGDLNVGSYISIGNSGTGQIVGFKKAVVEGATTILTAAHSGSVFFINGDTAASDYTLPATVAGLNYKWVWTANCNNAITITTADTTDTTGDMFLGGLLISSAAAVNNFLESAADKNCITVDDNAANTAGGPGSWIEVICTEDGAWFVHGVINSTTDADSVGAHFTDVD